MSTGMNNGRYVVTSALMGFGHLRAAHNIASYGHAPVLRVDREPYVRGVDRFVWNATQALHTYGSKDAESKNQLFYKWFEGVMRIPDDHESPSLNPSRFILTAKRFGLGKMFFDLMNRDHPPLVHTFYLHAMLSLYWRYPGKNYLLLCDTDFHRVWVPVNPREKNLEYMVPISRSADRLKSYGVPGDRIHVTGFPLPVANTGLKDLVTLTRDFEIRKERIRRDSNVPMTIMFPFSGAGAYSNVLAELVKAMLDHLREGSVRLVVSCGDNEDAQRNAENLFVNYGLEESEFTEIMFDRDLFNSFDRFNLALKSVDVIVTKPGEIVFYAGLGIPMVFLPPIGAHEARNREYLIENGCAVDMEDVSRFAEWLEEKRRNESLLELAEMGYQSLPKGGAFEIDELVRGGRADQPEPDRLETHNA